MIKNNCSDKFTTSFWLTSKFYKMKDPFNLNKKDNQLLEVNKSLNATFHMAVNFATGLSLWLIELLSALWDLNIGHKQFITHNNPQYVKTNKKFSIKSLIIKLTLHYALSSD